MTLLRKIFTWILLSPALLPLVFWQGLIYPFMTPKTLLLRSLGVVGVALFVYLVAAGEDFYWSRLKNKLSWIPAALLAVAYAASLIGIDFSLSFWSTFSRGDGLLTLTVIIAFFYFILLAADRKFFNSLANVVAWVGSIAALFAFLQWVKLSTGIDLPIYTDPANRLGGTLDNAAFLASYLSLTFFATLAVVKEYSKLWRRVLYGGAALQIVAIILTATRGSFVALGIALLLALVYWGWFRPAEKKEKGTLKKYSRAGVIALVALGLLFFIFRGQLANVPFEPVQRLASISLSDSTVASRLFIWKEVGAEALQRPLTGVGAEHISVLFDKVYDPGAIIEQWFDRTHNSYLDYFAQFGIFGLIFYLGVVISTGYIGWRLWKAGTRAGIPARPDDSGHSGGFLFLITLVYAVQNFFVFDTGVTLWTLFAFFAAGLALHLSNETDAAGATALRLVPGAPVIGAIIAVMLLFLLVPVAVQPLRANVDLFDGYLDQTSDVQGGIASMQAGYALDTYANLEYGYEAYQMYTGVQLTALKGQDLIVAYQFAAQTLESNFTRYPYDARTALYLAHVLDSVPPGEPMDTQTLGQALARSIALSPKRAQAWYIKANLSISQGDAAANQSDKIKDYQQAISVLEAYVQIEPGAAEPYYVIASLYLGVGDTASAQQWASEGLSLYKAPDAETAHRAAAYYIKVQDWAHAESFLKDIVAENPEDYASTYDLAKISYLAGDVGQAKQLVAQLRIANPGYVETDPAFLKALGQQ